MKRIILAITLLLLSSPVHAQTRAYVGATVHTLNGEALENATVVVEGDTIAAVGADVAVPSGAEVIDVTGKVLTPGLIDVSTQLGLVEIWAVRSSVDPSTPDPMRAAFRTRDVYNPDSVAIPVARTGGVTSVQAAPSGGLVSGTGVHCELAGELAGEACSEQDAALHIQLGSRGASASGSSRGEAQLDLRELFDDAQYFKTREAAVDTNRARDLKVSRLDLKALWPALDGSMPVFVGVDRASDIEHAVEWAEAYGLKIVISGGAEAWKVSELLAEKKIPVVVDPMLNAPESFDQLGARADNATLLAEAGVTVVISTFSVHSVRLLRQSAGNAVRAGLPWGDALAAVTSQPAELLGLASQLGKIAPGYRANLVVWSGDPLELSTTVERMVIGGESVSLETRQSALFERYESGR